MRRPPVEYGTPGRPFSTGRRYEETEGPKGTGGLMDTAAAEIAGNTTTDKRRRDAQTLERTGSTATGGWVMGRIRLRIVIAFG